MEPVKANGVNYYMFAKPQTWFRTCSELSNPISPYYQAWVGGYASRKYLTSESIPRVGRFRSWTRI